jgi:hypothetical protein
MTGFLSQVLRPLSTVSGELHMAVEYWLAPHPGLLPRGEGLRSNAAWEFLRPGCSHRRAVRFRVRQILPGTEYDSPFPWGKGWGEGVRSGHTIVPPNRLASGSGVNTSGQRKKPENNVGHVKVNSPSF